MWYQTKLCTMLSYRHIDVTRYEKTKHLIFHDICLLAMDSPRYYSRVPWSKNWRYVGRVIAELKLYTDHLCFCLHFVQKGWVLCGQLSMFPYMHISLYFVCVRSNVECSVYCATRRCYWNSRGTWEWNPSWQSKFYSYSEAELGAISNSFPMAKTYLCDFPKKQVVEFESKTGWK